MRIDDRNGAFAAAPRRAALPLLLACSLVSACSSLPDPEPEVDVLASWMEGSFSTARQSKALPTDFFDIRLETVRIWPERDDGIWLYVEQASATSLEKPYRQRVYRLQSHGFGQASSEVYTLPGKALDWAGAYKRPRRFDTLAPDALRLREGCTIHLKKQAEVWVGGTRGRGCASSLRGAAYATSLVRVFEGRLESWDRGFDVNGEQVWGSAAGAYIFERTSKLKK